MITLCTVLFCVQVSSVEIKDDIVRTVNPTANYKMLKDASFALDSKILRIYGDIVFLNSFEDKQT